MIGRDANAFSEGLWFEPGPNGIPVDAVHVGPAESVASGGPGLVEGGGEVESGRRGLGRQGFG